MFNLKFLTNLKIAVSFLSSDCCIFFLSDHTSVFCSSLLDLRILIFCRKGKMHFDHMYGLTKRSIISGYSFLSNNIFLILVISSPTQCFRIRPRLQLSFPRTRRSINQYYSAWCTTHQDSTFNVSIFLVSFKREGEERETQGRKSHVCVSVLKECV